MLLFHEAVQTAQSLSNKPVGMTTGGWIFMSVVWTTVISLAVFCYRKVLQKAEEKRRRAFIETEAMQEQSMKE